MPIATGGWAGSGGVVNWAITNYHLTKAYPDLFDKETVLRGVNFIFGAGVVIIILLDSMHGSINSVTTVSGFGPPVLAVIPHIELPNEKRRNNRKDLALYLFTGTYYAGVTAVLMMELIAKEMR